MTNKNTIFLSFVVLLLILLFIYIVFSNYGYSELTLLTQEQHKLVQINERLAWENRALSIEIERLKNDLAYIESIARHELGMIKKDEIILKPQKNRVK